jgi:hypothetical protein
VDPTAGHATVIARLRPERAGVHDLSIGVNDGDAVDVRQVVYP